MTHFSTKTNRRERCRATKKPCQYGDHQPIAQSPTEAAFVEELRQAQPNPPITNPIIARAVETPLGWTGEKPTWWADFQNQIAAHPTLPTTAELLDVIDSPIGKLAVIWQDTSQQENDLSVQGDSGYGVYDCHYRSLETGARVGYIKMSYVNDETIKRSFGDDEFTPFRYLDRYTGRSYGMKDYDKRVDGDPELTAWYEAHGDPTPRRSAPLNYAPAHTNLAGEALLAKRRELWINCQQNLGHGFENADGGYTSAINVNASHLPDDATVAKDLKKFAREGTKQINEAKRQYATPYVDFSRVDRDDLKGKGFGTALYIYTARGLAQRGLTLRGSGLQSGDAQRTWARFKQQFPRNYRTVTSTYKGRKNTNPILDFRDAA